LFYSPAIKSTFAPQRGHVKQEEKASGIIRHIALQ
jgi:hypothetical protein